MNPNNDRGVQQILNDAESMEVVHVLTSIASFPNKSTDTPVSVKKDSTPPVVSTATVNSENHSIISSPNTAPYSTVYTLLNMAKDRTPSPISNTNTLPQPLGISPLPNHQNKLPPISSISRSHSPSLPYPPMARSTSSPLHLTHKRPSAAVLSFELVESHMAIDNGDKKRKFRCTIGGCDRGFPSRAHLERHQRGVHYKIKPFQCPHPSCDKTFSRQDNMMQHFKCHAPRI